MKGEEKVLIDLRDTLRCRVNRSFLGIRAAWKEGLTKFFIFYLENTFIKRKHFLNLQNVRILKYIF